MKRLLFLSLNVMLSALILSSCGGSRKAQTVDPYSDGTMVKVENEECEEEAQKKSEFLRGYGIGTSADKMMARDMAALNARNEILTQAEIVASNVTKRFNQQRSSSNGAGAGMSREDQGKVQLYIKNVAEQTLSGARIICSNTYRNGQNYEVHVCVELTGVNFIQESYKQLSNDESLRIDYDYDKFKEEAEGDLEDYRQQNGYQ